MSKMSNEYGSCYYCVCDNCSMLYDLYIKKEHRRKGHARDLVQTIIEDNRSEGYEGDIKIKAEPYEDRISKEELVKFYNKMNLKVVRE